jgi:hypothetical protein
VRKRPFNTNHGALESRILAAYPNCGDVNPTRWLVPSRKNKKKQEKNEKIKKKNEKKTRKKTTQKSQKMFGPPHWFGSWNKVTRDF